MTPPTKKQKHTPASTDPVPNHASLTSLRAYVANLFYSVVVHDDDDVFNLIYSKNWSRGIDVFENAESLNFRAFHSFLQDVRATITDRQLISQTFVVAADEGNQGWTGHVAHTSKFSGLKDGQRIVGVVAPVLKVGWEDGRRKIETESFVVAYE